MKHAVLLLSGGLDSTVALSLAQATYRIQKALFFDYGQKAMTREWLAAQKIAQHYHIDIEKIALPFLQAFTQKIQPPSMQTISDANEQTAQAVWIPNRNGLFLNIAACFAEMLQAPILLAGFNAEEAVTFPDNSSAFVAAQNQTFQFSTRIQAHIENVTGSFNKQELVQIGINRQAPLQQIYSCYRGDAKHCGSCESCLRLKAALIANQADILLQQLFDT